MLIIDSIQLWSEKIVCMICAFQKFLGLWLYKASFLKSISVWENNLLHMYIAIYISFTSLVAQLVKNLLQCGTPGFNPLVGKIPWRREWQPTPVFWPGVRPDWATSLWLFTFMQWRRKWQPTPVFLPGESQGRDSLVGCRLWGHTESDTMKRLSSSSSSIVHGDAKSQTWPSDFHFQFNPIY